MWQPRKASGHGHLAEVAVEKKYTSDEIPLDQVLSEAMSGKLQLPDFQRGWVWDDDHIASLLASISVSYPIGVVMTLQTGNPEVHFRPQPLEGVRLQGDVEPEMLILDGQQRITSLFLALKSGRPVPTRDSKKRAMARLYYADMALCVDPFGDREEAIFSVPSDGIVKAFGGDVKLDVSTREQEIQQRMFPLAIVLDFSETMAWQLDFLENGPGEMNDRLEMWKEFNSAIITAFVQYQVPSIQLVRSTPKEAVCQVFEKVNTGGVSLTVFELLTATYAADDFRLRDDWAAREERLQKHEVLKGFEATDFLQVVTLLSTLQRRSELIAVSPEDKRIPPVSCKRRDVLQLALPDYRKWADIATDAMDRVAPFLHGEHIFQARDVPYTTQLVPLASIFSVLGEKAEGQGVRQLLRRWFWCGVFGEMYGGSTETRFAMDLQDVVAWVVDDAEEPRTVREAQFQADRLLSLKSRLSAAYKGLFALQMKRGARDFRTGNTIDVHAYFDDAIDIHHIFPKDRYAKWCQEHGIDVGVVDTVVNKTAIDAKTNKKIGGNAPSVYLESIESAEKIDADELDAILQSHDIDPLTLRHDDLPAFFNRRFERLLKQIEEAMGKPANRSVDAAESPFRDPERDVERLIASVRALMQSPESKVIERKSTGLRNLHTGDKDPEIEWSLVRALAGFMNASGGSLLVGVDDDGIAVGIEQDYQFLRRQDRDGWELWLSDLVSSTLGKVAASETAVSICKIDAHDVARVDVGPAPGEVFARPPKSNGVENFYVRINNRTEELKGQELLDYQRKRWPS
jgi:hypothetical protein